MPSLSFIIAFIGAGIGMLIGVLIFSEVNDVIDCKLLPEETMKACEQSKDTAWAVVGILPIALFFAIFQIFGGLGDSDGFGSGIKLPKIPKILRKNGKFVSKNLTLNQKMMLFLGLAKVKKAE